MELIKLNEAYTLTDNTEKGWSINGQVTKENNGIVNINFSVNNNIAHIGTYNYTSHLDNNISINVNSTKESNDELIEYGDKLVDEILEILNIKGV